MKPLDALRVIASTSIDAFAIRTAMQAMQEYDARSADTEGLRAAAQAVVQSFPFHPDDGHGHVYGCRRCGVDALATPDRADRVCPLGHPDCPWPSGMHATPDRADAARSADTEACGCGAPHADVRCFCGCH